MFENNRRRLRASIVIACTEARQQAIGTATMQQVRLLRQVNDDAFGAAALQRKSRISMITPRPAKKFKIDGAKAIIAVRGNVRQAAAA